jgi:hypothetical protein
VINSKHHFGVDSNSSNGNHHENSCNNIDTTNFVGDEYIKKLAVEIANNLAQDQQKRFEEQQKEIEK